MGFSVKYYQNSSFTTFIQKESLQSLSKNLLFMSLIIFPVVSLCFVSLKIVYFMYCCSLFISFLVFFSFPFFGEWIYLLSLLRFFRLLPFSFIHYYVQCKISNLSCLILQMCNKKNKWNKAYLSHDDIVKEGIYVCSVPWPICNCKVFIWKTVSSAWYICFEWENGNYCIEVLLSFWYFHLDSFTITPKSSLNMHYLYLTANSRSLLVGACGKQNTRKHHWIAL